MGDNYSEELKREVNNITNKLREINEKQGLESSELKRYMDNSDKKMEEFDKITEKINSKYADNLKKAEELKERIIHLEALATVGVQAKETTTQEVIQVMNAMLQKNWQEFVRDEKNIQKATNVLNSIKNFKHAENNDPDCKRFYDEINIKASADLLRSDIGEFGGFLCPPEYSAMLEKNMIEYSPIRQYARVKRTSSKIYREPTRTGIPSATRPGEAQEGGTSVSNYSLDDFTPHRLTNTTPVTHDELAFNAYNLANELLIDNGEAFAVKEGREFVIGTGIEQGLGFEVDPNVPELDTATSTLTFDDLIRLSGELKTGYNPMYFFNRRTMSYLRLLKDGSNRYLWNGPFGDAGAAAAPTINGYRYSAAFIDMDDFDVNDGYPVLFADMMRFYQIVDRTDVTIIRDEYTRKKEGVVEFTMNKWCVGKPKIKEAGVRLKKIP